MLLLTQLLCRLHKLATRTSAVFVTSRDQGCKSNFKIPVSQKQLEAQISLHKDSVQPQNSLDCNCFRNREDISMCNYKINIFFSFFLMVKTFPMFLQKYLKAVFSTEQLSHAETTNNIV